MEIIQKRLLKLQFFMGFLYGAVAGLAVTGSIKYTLLVGLLTSLLKGGIHGIMAWIRPNNVAMGMAFKSYGHWTERFDRWL